MLEKIVNAMALIDNKRQVYRKIIIMKKELI